MGAMHEFLKRLDSEPSKCCYRDLDAVWNSRARGLNERLQTAQLPVQVANLFLDMDDLLSATVALQLDVPITICAPRAWR